MNEQSPMPCFPISLWPGMLLVAPKIGGCGSCSGFGSTRRFAPMRQYLPSAWYSSSVHALDDVAERLAPHLARLVGLDVEAFELGSASTSGRCRSRRGRRR